MITLTDINLKRYLSYGYFVAFWIVIILQSF